MQTYAVTVAFLLERSQSKQSAAARTRIPFTACPRMSETIRRVVRPFETPRGTMMTRVTHAVLVAVLLTVPVLVERAYAHHGAGLYDMRKNVELEGKITRVDFVNPHTYVYFDVVGTDGKVLAMKCETRGATVLRRSGWSPEMFVKGTTIKISGHPHREDPTACTVETMTLGNKPTLERYQQLSEGKSNNRSNRPYRLSNGKPN